MKWYFEVLKKYAVFGGRARRKEFWMFTLFNIIITCVLMFTDGFSWQIGQASTGPLVGIYTLAVCIPGLAVHVRRLHDTGRSGWWFFIPCVPLIGGIILIFFLIQEGEQGSNDYGPDPKAESVPAE